MSLRCKPGDLAYATKAFFPENVGMVVQVLEIDNMHAISIEDGPRWICKCHPIRTITLFTGIVKYDVTQVWIPDRYLIPFAGPSITHTIDVEIDIGVST